MDENAVETLIENKPIPDPGEECEDESVIEDDLEEGVAYQSLSESDSDDEFRKITNFSAEEAHEILYNQLSYTKIFIDYDLQKELTLNVSNEHPWVTIKKDLLEEYLSDNTVETENLRAKLSLFEAHDSVLIGFHCPGQDVVEEGIFIVYDEIESILVATELIRKLEIFQRFKIKRALQKRPTRGIIPRLELKGAAGVPKRPLVSVELQTSYPIYKGTPKSSFRRSSDCRDGYAELVPSDSQAFKNVYRRRISQAIQSAPQRIDREQQTDPTFPTNAHTQYFYEITREGRDSEPGATDDGKSSATEAGVEQEEGTTGEGQHKSAGDQHEGENSEDDETILSMEAVQQKPVAVSRQIKELIRTLDYNQIDMYRNEYDSIGGREPVPKFKVPFLEEVFCFNDIDIAKTGSRYVSHIEWHPQYSGLFVATYTWNTLSTFVGYAADHKVDPVNQIILQPNYVYMWSFEDILNPLLSFESPREVATASFHPMDPNCLVGGLVNGQVILWDLTGVLENVGKSDELSLSEMQHREDMRKFLHWTKHSFNNDVVKRSAISSLEFSQTDRITQIKWLNSSIELSCSGNIEEQPEKAHRYFVTSSLDGTVAFWNLEDGSIPEENVESAKPKKKQQTPLPETKKTKSRFEHFDRKFRPQFVVVLQLPISSFGLNEAKFIVTPVDRREAVQSSTLSLRREFRASEVPFALEREFTVEDEEEGAFHNQVLVTTTMGDLMTVKWKSSETDPAGASNRQEKPILHPYPAIHDGPIVALDKNPLLPLLVVAVGQTTVSVWRTDYTESAIYWQHRNVELTNCKWSLQRPSVFFLSRVDGSIEVWDLLSKTEDPCLVETISGGILTTLSQHRLPMSEDILAVGDFNSNIRIFKVPRTFSQFTPEHQRQFNEQINQEVDRKRGLRLWQEKWMNENADILQVRNVLQQERITTGNKLMRDMGKDARTKKASTGKKEEKQKTLEEIGELKWERMNLKRLMKIMMTIKGIDAEECNQKTLPIREQRAYNDFKREAIRKNFSQINADVAEIRSRILPVQEDVQYRRETVRKLVKESILADDFNQEEFDQEMEKQLAQVPERTTYTLSEIKQRGRHIREILNKSSGGNFVHKDMYEMYKKGRNGSAISSSTNQKEKSLSSSPTKRMFSTSASPN